MIWSNQAAQIVKAVLPFLIIKKSQANLFLKFIKLKKGMGKTGRTGLTDNQWSEQDKIYQRMKVLNA